MISFSAFIFASAQALACSFLKLQVLGLVFLLVAGTFGLLLAPFFAGLLFRLWLFSQLWLSLSLFWH